MMKNILSLSLACAVVLCARVAAAVLPAPLVFDAPAENDRGAMVLGNGEIGALAWVSADGTLHTVLQRSDSWNEGGSHVKVGALDYATACPVDAGTFHQELSLAAGTFDAAWKSRGKDIAVHYRVQRAVGDVADAAPFAVCAVTGAPVVAAQVVNWRLYPSGSKAFSSEALGNRLAPAAPKDLRFRVASDVLVTNGWYHLNDNATVAQLMACYDRWQATGDLGKPDLLSHRAFGALTRTDRAGDRALFVTAVTSLQPVADGNEWERQTAQILAGKGWNLAEEPSHRAAHTAAWHAFWSRSHLVVTPATGARAPVEKLPYPYNPRLPVSFGHDSTGGTRFDGTLAVDRAQTRLNSEGLRFVATFNTKNPKANQRLIDNITPGGRDGSLVDILGGRLRLILGGEIHFHPNAIPANRTVSLDATVTATGEIALVLDGARWTARRGEAADDVAAPATCAAVTRAWACQRYTTACAGRGRLPIRFNGSLFTTQEQGDPDYRKWGHGYWWQNTRLPYYPMLAAGDDDEMRPLFNLYLPLLDFNVKRTRKYLGHAGAYFPECMQPWGDHFVESYGARCDWKDRTDKLQDARWHKYEWVGQLELSLMLLDYAAYTGRTDWFVREALPSVREYVRYFDAHYAVGADGRYDWQPSQALETWLDCTAPMPEVAGLTCVTARLLALEKGVLSEEDRAFFTRVASRLPPLPTRRDEKVGEVYSPAAKVGRNNNVESPELYGVFPFRLCSFEKPNVALGRRTYATRRFRHYRGWSPDELFAAELGLADEAQKHLAARVLHNSAEGFRWPAYWGPNFDWRPDQCAGGNIQNIPQLMLLQCEGRKIYLLPAWPKNWNCAFRLHAPGQTLVEGRVEDGLVKDLVVTPAARRADVVITPPFRL